MKIIKFKDKKKYRYNRKVTVKNLILKIFIGLHDFEKKKKQRVRFNIDITTDSNIKPDNNNLLSIVNYEDTINPKNFYSKSRNSTFENEKVRGKVLATLVDGRILFQNDVESISQ